MQLGNVTIITPEDDPMQFDPAWRHKIAAAWRENPTAKWGYDYYAYKTDPWIVEHKKFLDLYHKGQTSERGPRFTDDQKRYRHAFRWYQGRNPCDSKFKIDALLLTGVPYSLVGKSIAGDESIVPCETFRIYEKLFFNIRLKDGTLHPSSQLRMFFANPGGGHRARMNTPDTELWRIAAAVRGYHGLMRLWAFNDPVIYDPGIDANLTFLADDTLQLAQSVMIESALRGNITRDVNELMRNYLDHGRLQKESGGTDSTTAGVTKTLQAILAATAPQMVSVTKSVDEHSRETLDIQARLLSQRQSTGVAQTNVLDSSEDKLNTLMRLKVKGGGRTPLAP